MAEKVLTALQREALEGLFRAVYAHEMELRGSLPGSGGKMTRVAPPLSGALHEILAALATCQKAGI
jgi:hypothetical protein